MYNTCVICELVGDETWPIHILENEARVAVWMLTSLMGVNSRGIPAQACRLAERYLNTRFCELGTRVGKHFFFRIDRSYAFTG